MENLNHAPDEKLLLFGCACFPIVRLLYCHNKPNIPSPLLAVCFILIPRFQVNKVLYAREVLHVPRLANGEGAVGILAGLMQTHPTRGPHRDDDNARFLVRRVRTGRGRGLWVGGILLDANVGDVGLDDLAGVNMVHDIG